MNLGQSILLCVTGCSVFALMGCQELPQAVPVPDVGPCAEVKGALAQKRLDVLAQIRDAGQSSRFYSGQNVGHVSYEPDRSWLETTLLKTGQTPAIMGIDLGYGCLAATDTQLEDFADRAAAHVAKGGLVTFSLHPDNPVTLGDARDLDFYHPGNILTPGAPGFAVWTNILNRTAHFAQLLKDRGIVALFRPFHEMNGDWFWWRVQKPSDFQALWRAWHRDFEARGLDNLLWVYAPNFRQYDQPFPSDELAPYPGDACVDITALDVYADDPSVVNVQDSLSKVLSLGKPFGFAEVGPIEAVDGSFDATRVANLKSLAPEAAYFVMWHSWPRGKLAIADVKNGKALMDSAAVRTIERP